MSNPDAGQSKNRWDELVGPFYNVAALTAYLSITPAELENLVESGQVIQTKLLDGTRLFPSFQFDSGSLLPRLAEVPRTFGDLDIDEWTFAAMLNAKELAWGDRTAAELMRTEWADEVVHQLTYGERAPLDRRARFAVQYEIGREVLRALMPLICELPITLNASSLVVGEDETGFGAAVLVNDSRAARSTAVLSFALNGEPFQIAADVAEDLRRGPHGSSG